MAPPMPTPASGAPPATLDDRHQAEPERHHDDAERHVARARGARARPGAGEPVREMRRLGRHLAALDHRHALAMLHLELLRSLAHRHEDDEHAGKHADDEHECKQFFAFH